MTFQAASKTFLLGEYAVLTDGKALLLATPPYFTLTHHPDHGIHYKNLAPQSPASKLYQITPQPDIYFHDPHHSNGGFGASGAQFVLLAQYLGTKNPWKIWQQYQQYDQVSSGADVLAQSTTGLIYLDITQQQLMRLEWSFPEWRMILIHTGRKLATHHYLANLSIINFDTLTDLVNQGYQALARAQAPLFLQSIKTYAQTLAALSLVTHETQLLLNTLSDYPEVLATKGCGAMGAEVVLAIVPTNKIDSFAARLKRPFMVYPPAPAKFNCRHAS